MSRSTLARHRFARTSAEGGGGGNGGENQQQNNQQQNNQQGGASSGKPNAKDPETGEDLGFPAETPTKDMTDAQQAAYWRAESKKQQKKLPANLAELQEKARKFDEAQGGQQQQNNQQTVDEKTIREEAGADAAEVSLRGILATKGKKKDEIDELLVALNFRSFLTEQGRVDADKVIGYADKLVPAGSGGGGGYGQGRRENAPQDKAAAGKAEADRRFGNQQQQSAQPRFGPLSRRA